MNIVGLEVRRVYFAEVEDNGVRYHVELTSDGYETLQVLLQHANTSTAQKISKLSELTEPAEPAPVEAVPEDMLEKLMALGINPNNAAPQVRVQPDADLTTVFGSAMEDDGVEEL